jgi:AcrR family transcriptional regulator
MTSSRSGSPQLSHARARLLATATSLFYAEGIHGAGVDRIVTDAKVTRATFYRHFPGKEDLVVAYLRGLADAVRTRVGDDPATPAGAVERLRWFVAGIGDELCRNGFRGCAFIHAAAEYPDPSSPVHRTVLQYRGWMTGMLADAFAGAGHPEPEGAARHLVMLRDGAMVAAYLGDPALAAETLTAGLEGILANRIPQTSTAPDLPSATASSSPITPARSASLSAKGRQPIR